MQFWTYGCTCHPKYLHISQKTAVLAMIAHQEVLMVEPINIQNIRVFRICINMAKNRFNTASSTYLLSKQLTVAVTNLGTQSTTDAIIIKIEITIAAPELKWGRSGCIMHRYRSTAEKYWSLRIKRIIVIYV